MEDDMSTLQHLLADLARASQMLGAKAMAESDDREADRQFRIEELADELAELLGVEELVS
jgi:hypothetical protein